MELTGRGIKFESIDEAVHSLAEAGYKVDEISKGILYAVIPLEVSKNIPTYQAQSNQFLSQHYSKELIYVITMGLMLKLENIMI